MWQNSVLLRPGRSTEAEALIKADYHARNLYIQVSGSDALTYFGMIRDSVLKTLQTTPELPYEGLCTTRRGRSTRSTRTDTKGTRDRTQGV